MLYKDARALPCKDARVLPYKDARAHASSSTSSTQLCNTAQKRCSGPEQSRTVDPVKLLADKSELVKRRTKTLKLIGIKFSAYKSQAGSGQWHKSAFLYTDPVVVNEEKRRMFCGNEKKKSECPAFG